ncbi:hypothetical protein LTR28_007553, partial [Elasticomyces elasticus]
MSAEHRMPYNTRRKSLSLAELGIQVPKRARTVSHPSAPSPPGTVAEGEAPPAKKPKRSHDSPSSPPGTMSPPRSTTIRIKACPPRRAVEHTPPPSPGSTRVATVDTEGIGDDIVVAAIEQLQKTGNRPHLVKELAAALAPAVAAIEKSANPSALISSRLTAYLHRTWPSISPCPLAKELSPVHPRRLYFYLTTSQHQPIPDTVEVVPNAVRIITPSISSASNEEEEKYTRERVVMSPSPELDLFSPELDGTDVSPAATPGASFSARASISHEHPTAARNLSHNRRH